MIYDELYWVSRYENHQTQWDTGHITTPLKEYIDQIEDKNFKILIPGCGNAHEALYLWQSGFRNIYLLDIAQAPLDRFHSKVPDFPKKQLLHGDFFELNDSFDLILEQTFFCALHPSQRHEYAKKMNQLLKPGGKLVGVLFNIPLNDNQPPFGGHLADYELIFNQHLDVITMEPCTNSIAPRKGNELFIILQKK